MLITDKNEAVTAGGDILEEIKDASYQKSRKKLHLSLSSK